MPERNVPCGCCNKTALYMGHRGRRDAKFCVSTTGMIDIIGVTFNIFTQCSGCRDAINRVSTKEKNHILVRPPTTVMIDVIDVGCQGLNDKDDIAECNMRICKTNWLC